MSLQDSKAIFRMNMELLIRKNAMAAIKMLQV